MSQQMTSRERIVESLHGRKTDRLPWSPFLAYIWEHFPQEIQDRGQLAFLNDVGADPLWRGAACPTTTVCSEVQVATTETEQFIHCETVTPVGKLNMTWRKNADAKTNFLIEHPVKTAEDLKVQLWIEEHTEVIPADPQPVRDALKLDGLAIGMLIPRSKTIFQWMVESLMGTEEVIYALADYPQEVESLLAAASENDRKAVEIALQSDFDYFLTWEDSSTQNYSPTLYDRYISPQIRQWCRMLAASGKHYIQHACGHVKALLPLMKRDGVLAVESLSTLPTGNITNAQARQAAGPEMGIIGGIEPTNFLNLSLQQLEPYVERVISELSGGRFVLANSDSCPPGVSVEKFKLVGDIVRRVKTR